MFFHYQEDAIFLFKHLSFSYYVFLNKIIEELVFLFKNSLLALLLIENQVHEEINDYHIIQR